VVNVQRAFPCRDKKVYRWMARRYSYLRQPPSEGLHDLAESNIHNSQHFVCVHHEQPVMLGIKNRWPSPLPRALMGQCDFTVLVIESMATTSFCLHVGRTIMRPMACDTYGRRHDRSHNNVEKDKNEKSWPSIR